MEIEKSAGAVVYRISDAGDVLFLLLQSAAGKPWGFPKGKMHRGESEVEAALREIAEESGLTNMTLDEQFRLSVSYQYRRGRIRVKKEVIYFLTRTDTSTIQLSSEHVAYRWAPYAYAMKLVLFENSRLVLRKAYEQINAQH